jgi:hypothetical protein
VCYVRYHQSTFVDDNDTHFVLSLAENDTRFVLSLAHFLVSGKAVFLGASRGSSVESFDIEMSMSNNFNVVLLQYTGNMACFDVT